MDKPERILPIPDIDAWFTAPEEPVDNEELASTKPEHHAPEPWRISEHPDGTGERLVVDANGEIVLTESEWVSPEEDAANHARIVECVNAMAGIQDPKAFVARHEQADHAQWLSRVEPCEPVELGSDPNAPSLDMTHRNREYGGEG